MKEPVFGVILRGSEQNVVISQSMAESIQTSPGASSAPFINHTLEKVFGDRGSIRNLSPASRRELDQNGRNLLMREPNITEGIPVINVIQRETANLVTFCRSVVDQLPWERTSEVTVANGDDGLICEANLFALVRNFVGHTTTSASMGLALLDAFPGVLDDLQILDDWFFTLSMGIPGWIPVPGVSAAHAARGRLHQAFATFQDAFAAWEDGVDPGVKFRDFDDVSEPVKQQARIFRKLGLSPSASAPGYLSLLWSMNAQTSSIVFWNILRIFADRTLLEDVRKEIAPYAKATRPSLEETGFPFQEPPRLSIDLDGLCKSCPLLRASVYETMRLDSAPLSFRKLTSDITIAESNGDARKAGLTHPRTYQLHKNDNVTIPHGVFHRDTQNFSNPDQYDPLRFIRTDGTGKRVAYLHSIKPSGGSLGCEDCMPSETDILAFTAGILAMWDIEPTSSKGLVIPEHKPASVTFLPKKDIRVGLTRRV